MKDKLIRFFEVTGFTWFIPIVKLLARDNPQQQLTDLIKMVGVPVLAFAIFLGLWHVGAAKVVRSLGQVPGPVQVWEQATLLVDAHYVEREKEVKFVERQ